MGEFNTQQVMAEIQKKIFEEQPCLSDLHFMSFYYRKLIRILKEPEKLVLFGAGRYGEIILSFLEQEGIQTAQCFCDNDVQALGRYICGLEVISPKDALRRYPNACFVITPKDYENEILRQLVHMGVSIDNIVIFNIKNTGIPVEI